MNSALSSAAALLLTALSFGGIENTQYRELPNKKIEKDGITYIPLEGGMRYPSSVWSSVGYAREGFVYVAVCDHITNSTVFEYDIQNDKLHVVGDLNSQFSFTRYAERQPKCHSPLLQNTKDGLVYYVTDAGDRSVGDVWDHEDEGYQGGFIVGLNPLTKAFTNLGCIGNHWGAKCLAVDTANSFLYFNVLPGTYFMKYDLRAKKLHNLGRINGLDAPRALFFDAWNNVYNVMETGSLLRYNAEKDTLEYLNVSLPLGSTTGSSQWAYGPGRQFVVGLEAYAGVIYKYTPAKNGPGKIDSLGSVFKNERLYIRNLNIVGQKLYMFVNEREKEEMAGDTANPKIPHLYVYDLEKRQVEKKLPLAFNIGIAFGHPIVDKNGYCYVAAFNDHNFEKKNLDHARVHLIKFHPDKLPGKP